MGLTTSCEAIERHANPAESEPDTSNCERVYVGRIMGKPPRDLVGHSVPDIVPANERDLKEREPRKKKPKQVDGTKAFSGAAHASPSRKQAPHKTLTKKATPKSASTKTPRPRAKKTPTKSKAKAESLESTPTTIPAKESETLASPAPPTPMNAHRMKILIGKQALAVIKEGTRIYIKSGEGNGGDTWWDSGIIRKVHARGRRYEVEWQGINNRGEEVDIGTEKRIDLPVTYSLGGAAAAAIAKVPAGTQATALARKGVLAEARIGSWCIQHPEESWGMLDPFGVDAT